MSDTVKLIIEIAKDVKIAFDNAESNDLKGYYYDHSGIIGNAIKNGTALPKGHGRLIDEKELRQDIIAHKYSIDFCKEHNIEQSINVGVLNILIADTPTIIEADKERD